MAKWFNAGKLTSGAALRWRASRRGWRI